MPSLTLRYSSSLRLRPILLPAEHGGWGFLLEPLLLGWLVAPGMAALWLSVATVAAFLARQPAKVLLQEQRRGRRTQRSRVAAMALLLELGAALLGLLLAIRAGGLIVLGPLLLALPLGALFLYFDARQPARTLPAELAAPAALASTTAAMALAGGWSWPIALAFWAAIVARALPAVLLVRTRIRLNKGRATSIAPPLVAHLLALATVTALVAAGLLPGLAILAFTILLLSALLLLTPSAARVPIKTLGFAQLGLGVLTVALIAIGAGSPR